MGRLKIFNADTGVSGAWEYVTYGIKGDTGAGGGGVNRAIHQTSHSLNIGDVVKYASSLYSKAQADSAANAEVVGMVSAVAGGDDFTLTTYGYVSGLTGLTGNTMYFLSPTSAGVLTATEPSAVGQVSKPVFFATSSSDGYFINYRGDIVSFPAITHFTTLTSDPISPTDGDAWIRTDINEVRVQVNSATYKLVLTPV